MWGIVMQNNEMKSNINIASNVYIRTENAEYEDVAYIEQITGYNALVKLSSKANSASVVLNLTYAQEQELKNNIPCTSRDNKLCEQTFGAVKVGNEIVWSCRCENVECENYEDCMNLPNSKRIDRDYINLDTVYITPKDDDVLNDLLFEEPIKNSYNSSTKEAETFYFEDTAFNYTKISDNSVIVQAPLNQNIIVNAKSGSGKTDTIIQRLHYVIEKQMIRSPSNILVLCYNKATQNYIQENLPKDGGDIHVSTLDAYATKNLYDIQDDKYLTLNYEERIDRYNSQISKMNLRKYEMVIFDEMHDFVNQRAMMVLNIAKRANCGVFLLGDKCQALYQEDAAEHPFSVDVVRLYSLLNKVFLRNIKKYELVINTLKESDLGTIATNIREGLLYKNLIEAKKIIRREFEKIETEKTFVEKIKPITKSNETLAFLCKNDSEAEYVSSLLYKNKVQHNLIRNLPNKYSYARWVGDILWDHCSDYITKEDFVERYTARVSDDEKKAFEMYELLLEFLRDYGQEPPKDKIDKHELMLTFVNGKEPAVELTNKIDRQITVSTVFKSKGEQYDNIYLVDFQIDKLGNDSIKLDKLHEIYGAIIRAKNSVKMINFKNSVNFKKTVKNHSYRTFMKYNLEYCTHFSIGDDVDTDYFILGDFKDVLQNQRYMSEVVRVNDKVELILCEDTYKIYHIQNTRKSIKHSQFLGVLSSEAFDDLKNAMEIYNNSILPNRMYDLYISQVVTVPQNVDSNKISSQFKKSKFTVGIEISGFAKLDCN